MKLLRDALAESYPGVTVDWSRLETPPSHELGLLASPVSFELARHLGESPRDVANKTVSSMRFGNTRLVEEARAEGPGYINFYPRYSLFAKHTLVSVEECGEGYGFVPVEAPERIIVEHTSANPIRPLHIGTARNSVIGDSLARLLEKRGHRVRRHFYIDDTGRQTALVAYGYSKLSCPQPEGKPDHFVGAIYAITNCVLEVRRLKKLIEWKESSPERDEAGLQKLKASLDDWIGVAQELSQRYPEIFSTLSKALAEDEDPEEEVNKLIRGYETGEDWAKKLVRQVVEICLEGFRETLSKAGIFFDSWDWESELVWSGRVSRVVDELRRTGFVKSVNGALELDAEAAVEELGLRQLLGLGESEIPPLTLVRSDGTTLYTTRDIAYSLLKFEQADRVISIIGIEQTLAQQHLRIALCLLGKRDEALKYVHFGYELVKMKGVKMSGRRGRYVTFDEVMEEAVKRAYEEVSVKSPQLPEEERRKIAEKVGIGAVKYALISVDPSKPVVFSWERVLDFEQNSAPFVQYAHARACNILKKAEELGVERGDPDFEKLSSPIERELVFDVARFPEVFIDSADNLKPSQIADFANSFAAKFNSFYTSFPVIRAEDVGTRSARLALVNAVRIVLKNCLYLMGIDAPTRM